MAAADHVVEWGHFGWSCSCGAGREWPLAPVTRGQAAARAHQRAAARRTRREGSAS